MNVESALKERTKKLVDMIAPWFEQEQWTIEQEDGRTIAVMSSGYGSGPAIVDLTSLTRYLDQHWS